MPQRRKNSTKRNSAKPSACPVPAAASSGAEVEPAPCGLVTQYNKDPVALKEAGNKEFQHHKFPAAVKLYTAAIEVKPDDPVLYSNRSAAHYENGQYLDCLHDIQSAFQRVSAGPQSLPAKLAARAVRASLWLGAAENAETWLEHESLRSSNLIPEALARQVKALRSQQSADFAPSVAAWPNPNRPCLLWHLDEYGTVGHDQPRSMLAAVTKDGQPVRDNEVGCRVPINPPVPHAAQPAPSGGDAPGRRNLSVFLGGFGDARHVLMTMMDVAEQAEDLSGVRLTLVLNDHVHECCARFLLLLVSLLQLSESAVAATMPRVHKRPVPVEDVGVQEALVRVFHTHDSMLLSEPVFQWLKEELEKLASATECPLPFVTCSGPDWEALCEVFEVWQEDRVGSENVLRMLERSAAMDMQMARGLNSAPSASSAPDLNSMAEMQRNELLQRVKEMPDDMVRETAASVGLPTGQPVPVLRALIEEGVREGTQRETPHESQHFSAVFETMPGLIKRPEEWDEMERSGRMPMPATLWEQYAGSHGLTAETEWMANPLLWPAKRPLVVDGSECPMAKPLEFMSDILSSEVFGYTPGRKASAIEYAGLVYLRVAQALTRLANADALHIVLCTGDVFELAQTWDPEVADEYDAPRRFDRMHLSNIPDYTGMLPVLTDTLPLLRSGVRHAVLSHNVMFNCTLFEDLEHYIQSATFLPTPAHAAPLLGAVFISGSLWGSDDASWAPAELPSCAGQADTGEHPGKALPAAPAEISRECFVMWMHMLIDQMVFPRQRATHSPLALERPLSLAALFPMLQRLAQVVPVHWLWAACEPIRSGSRAAAMRVPVQDWAPQGVPRVSCEWPSPSGSTCAVYPHAAHEEFITLAGIWRGRLPQLFAACNSPVGVYHIAPFAGLNMSLRLRGLRRPKSRMLGLVLAPPAADSLASVVSGLAMGRAQQRHHVQLLSAMCWVKEDEDEGVAWLAPDDGDDWILQFWLTEEAFERMSKYRVALVRTDSWQLVSSECLLESAEQVGTAGVVDALEMC